MSKGSRDRTADHEEFGKSMERIKRTEARRRKLQEKVSRKHRIEQEYDRIEEDENG